ncbi:MAG: MarR family winged helix-turn-helix transcriptional regulator [Lentisphaerae bacterium]|nr:MarR family winged helix-turn-helix transcriptional regulator [Lentisphaerota bacterium]
MRTKAARTQEELPPTQQKALAFIASHPGCQPRQLAAAFGYGERCWLAGAVVGKLATTGLVRRVPRPVSYRITRKGVAALVSLPDAKTHECQRLTLTIADFDEWGLAVAAKLGVVPKVVSALYWMINIAVDTDGAAVLAQEGFWGEGGLTEKGWAAAEETMAACFRWRSGLPSDADLGSIQERCAFAKGDIVAWRRKRYRVEFSLNCCGLVEEYPCAADGVAVCRLLYWFSEGEFFSKVGHVDTPASQTAEGGAI